MYNIELFDDKDYINVDFIVDFFSDNENKNDKSLEIDIDYKVIFSNNPMYKVSEDIKNNILNKYVSCDDDYIL